MKSMNLNLDVIFLLWTLAESLHALVVFVLVPIARAMKHEIGDGTRFAELAYVWDPNTIWNLLVRCTYPDYNAFISATEIVNSAEVGVGLKKIKG